MRLSMRGYDVVLFMVLAAGQATAQNLSYVIGSVPPLDARHGSTLSIQLKSPVLTGTFSHTLDPAYPLPVGTITLNAFSGLFSYTPSPLDKFEFRVRLMVKSAEQSLEQFVSIRPIPKLQAESDLIATSRGIPNAASSDY